MAMVLHLAQAHKILNSLYKLALFFWTRFQQRWLL